MVPFAVVSDGGGSERSIQRGGAVLGISVRKLRAIMGALKNVRHVATHKEADFDGLFSAWAVNVLKGQPRAPIYSGKGAAAGIERRVPGLLNSLGINLGNIKLMNGPYALFDAGMGSNKNVGASYEPDVCIDTHFGAAHGSSRDSIFSKDHAAVSTIITALIHTSCGEMFWQTQLGKQVAAGLMLGVMTDCGITNPTESSTGLYGTSFDKEAFDYLRTRADQEILGSYVASPFWSRLDGLVNNTLGVVGNNHQKIVAAFNESLEAADSDLTGVVAEKVMQTHGHALASVYGAFLTGGGFKVSFRLNPGHSEFRPNLVASAIDQMVASAEAACAGGEASWRSEGRVLGGFWPARGLGEARAVMTVLLSEFSKVVDALGAVNVARRRGRRNGTVA